MKTKYTSVWKTSKRKINIFIISVNRIRPIFLNSVIFKYTFKIHTLRRNEENFVFKFKIFKFEKKFYFLARYETRRVNDVRKVEISIENDICKLLRVVNMLYSVGEEISLN